MFLLVILKNRSLASKVNDEIRDVCKKLDDSAALVREESPEEGPSYAIAVAKIFETISSEILVRLYKQHPDIAPLIWQETQESKE